MQLINEKELHMANGHSQSRYGFLVFLLFRVHTLSVQACYICPKKQQFCVLITLDKAVVGELNAGRPDPLDMKLFVPISAGEDVM